MKSLIADQNSEVTFLSGDSGNFFEFIDLFFGVFALEVDRETLRRRYDHPPYVIDAPRTGLLIDPQLLVYHALCMK